MMTQLEILLEQINRQMKIIEEQFNTLNSAMTARDYLPDVKNVYDQPEVDPFTIRNSDGSYPLVPLLLAKAQVLNAIVMLQTRDARVDE